MLKKMYLKLLL